MKKMRSMLLRIKLKTIIGWQIKQNMVSYESVQWNLGYFTQKPTQN